MHNKILIYDRVILHKPFAERKSHNYNIKLENFIKYTTPLFHTSVDCTCYNQSKFKPINKPFLTLHPQIPLELMELLKNNSYTESLVVSLFKGIAKLL